MQKDLDEEDPEEDYNYTLMLKLWENQEPKLDLQLSEDSDGDEELSDSIHIQPSLAILITNLLLSCSTAALLSF